MNSVRSSNAHDTLIPASIQPVGEQQRQRGRWSISILPRLRRLFSSRPLAECEGIPLRSGTRTKIKWLIAHKIPITPAALRMVGLEGFGSLKRADLHDLDLSGANLQGLGLWRVNLSGANLTGANLSNAWLGEAKLKNTNLEGAHLNRTWLKFANLRGSNLRSANL